MFTTITVYMHSRDGKYFHNIWPHTSSQGIQGNFKLKKLINCLNQDEPGARTPDLPLPKQEAEILIITPNCTAENKYLTFTNHILY
jgi:hypothetical protein